MRVRPQRPTATDRRPQRAECAPAPAAPAPAAAPAPDDHPAERRHRAAVCCEDVAHYACSCGFQFQAAVTTSVACPHCGTAQAW